MLKKCKNCILELACKEKDNTSDCLNYKDEKFFVELQSETESLLIEAYRKIGSTIYWTEFNENDESFRKNGPRMHSEDVRSIEIFGDSIHLMDEFGSIIEDMKNVETRYTEDGTLFFFYSFSRSDLEKAIDDYWKKWAENL